MPIRFSATTNLRSWSVKERDNIDQLPWKFSSYWSQISDTVLFIWRSILMAHILREISRLATQKQLTQITFVFFFFWPSSPFFNYFFIGLFFCLFVCFSFLLLLYFLPRSFFSIIIIIINIIIIYLFICSFFLIGCIESIGCGELPSFVIFKSGTHWNKTSWPSSTFGWLAKSVSTWNSSDMTTSGDINSETNINSELKVVNFEQQSCSQLPGEFQVVSVSRFKKLDDD